MKILIKLIVLIVGAIIFVSCLSGENRNSAVSSPENVDAADSAKKTVFNFPSSDPNFPVPASVPEPFNLRQDYPQTYNSKDPLPWANLDPKADHVQYMQAVLKYCLEGNTDEGVDFRVEKNKVRNWYHAPWLHDDGQKTPDGKPIGNGREYLHGLTRERASRKFEIHRKQDVRLENWAIGFYNEPGGYTIGKIWADPLKPDPSQSVFPEGTVAFKLLFTDGAVEKVPFLAGTKEWTANIYPCDPKNTSDSNCSEPQKRVDRTVRLLQIDIAVKDADAGETGWVFGTFVYDASRKGSTVWEKMAEVGLSWGDDSTVSSMIRDLGAFRNIDLKQTYLNDKLIFNDAAAYTNEAYMLHHGLGGRLNGPVDNPVSSCISCHARAAVNQNGEPMRFSSSLSRSDFTVSEFNKFFSPVKSGTHLVELDGTTYTTTDYSLQISAGIRNFFEWSRKQPKTAGANPSMREDATPLPLVTRGK